MYTQAVFVTLLGLASVMAQDDAFDYSSYKAPPPAILMHKQALRHDGAFNYVFAADNGLKQGETIAPDGTRQGAYSYVDPNGQTISVKYTAGKDGFRILEGAHIPKQQAAPQGPPQGPPQYVSPTPQYSPQARSQFTPLRPQEPSSYEEDGPAPTPLLRPQPIPTFRSQIKPVQEYVPRPEDEHKGPHSFGSGYSFEFGGDVNFGN
nr:endocuticle structural glycoprotein SgAbd-8-like isoform X1 [Halyomorpha halys]